MPLFGTTFLDIVEAFQPEHLAEKARSKKESQKKIKAKAKALSVLIISLAIIVASVILLALKVEGAKEYCFPALGLVAGYWLK